MLTMRTATESTHLATFHLCGTASEWSTSEYMAELNHKIKGRSSLLRIGVNSVQCKKRNSMGKIAGSTMKHYSNPECRQGSLILGQVFLGTNFNFLVPVSTLIF